VGILRILGLDYGNKTIGVAVSDDFNKIAYALEVIWRNDPKSLKKSISRLNDIIKEYNINKIVLGFPKKTDNTLGERCGLTLTFKDKLSRNFKNIEIVLWDERFSTVFSKRALNEAKLSRDKINNVIDKMAAAYILQGYLDNVNKT
jgi:putative Holliday junction resolvase